MRRLIKNCLGHIRNEIRLWVISRKKGLIGFGKWNDVHIYSFSMNGFDDDRYRVSYCYNYYSKTGYVCENGSFHVNKSVLEEEDGFSKITDELHNHILVNIVSKNHKIDKRNRFLNN